MAAPLNLGLCVREGRLDRLEMGALKMFGGIFGGMFVI